MNNNNKNYFTSNAILNSNITFGFFTRNGGKSVDKFKSLNCSYSSGDNKSIVEENIKIAKKNLNLEKTKIKFLNQVHGNNIEIVDYLNFDEKSIADGSITKTKNISLAILTADCAPVFIFDREAEIISAIHIGWRGCFNNIVSKAINKIRSFDKTSKNIFAIIGPCLNKINFEVDKDFRDKLLVINHNYKIFFHKNKNNNIYFDMRGLIEYQLRESLINNIYHIDKNTYIDKNLFFSHRRSVHNGIDKTGRMINIIGFKQ